MTPPPHDHHVHGHDTNIDVHVMHMKLCAWVSKTNCAIHLNNRTTTQQTL